MPNQEALPHSPTPTPLPPSAAASNHPRPGPPCLPTEYWLKTSPLTPAAKFAPLYLRLHGDGVASTLLTPAPPKFIRWHDDEPSSPTSGLSILAVLWKAPDRAYGLTMGRPREKYAWEPVEIRHSEQFEGGFEWEKKEGVEGGEVLVWRGAEEGMGRGGFGGWVAFEWVHGFPQLFWVTGMGEKEVPESGERVEIVREWLVPRV